MQDHQRAPDEEAEDDLEKEGGLCRRVCEEFQESVREQGVEDEGEAETADADAEEDGEDSQEPQEGKSLCRLLVKS